jgi:hypothetical protein
VILYFTADLIFATRIRSTADAIGVPVRPVRTVERLRELLAEETVNAIIVDLDAGEMAIDLIDAAVAAEPPLASLAFGPHVNIEAFEAAHRAGASQVMPRGRFAEQLPSLLRALDIPPAT